MKTNILKRRKKWHIYARNQIAFANINVPEGFTVRLEVPTIQTGNELVIYAYKTKGAK